MAAVREFDAIQGDSGGEPARGRWPAWLPVSAFWLVTSALYAAQITVMSSMPNERFRLDMLLAWQVPFWTLWAGLTPIVFWLGHRYRLEGPHWRRAALMHAGAWLALSLLHVAACVALARTLVMPSAESFWMAARGFALSRIHFELLAYAATLGIGYGLEYRQRLRVRELSASRLETQLAHARLDALRMQLNPHFLFNTLHTVAALVRAQRNHEAVRMIAGLSDLLRRTLDGQPTQQTSLAEELAFIERYLDIQRVRFGDRLRVELRVPPETRDALVPALILQPLVENALRHGLAPRAAPGQLTIAAARENGRLRLDVIDDGVGWAGRETEASGPRTAPAVAIGGAERENGGRSATAVASDGRAALAALAAKSAQHADAREQSHFGVTHDGGAGRDGREARDVARDAASGRPLDESHDRSFPATGAVATLDAEERQTPGVGLSNTRSRLRHLYGGDASLDLADAPGGGARVTVWLPYRPDDAGAASAADVAAGHDTRDNARRDAGGNTGVPAERTR